MSFQCSFDKQFFIYWMYGIHLQEILTELKLFDLVIIVNDIHFINLTNLISLSSLEYT